MADMVLQFDIADLTAAAPASGFTSVTAGGAGNNAAVNGLAIDRFSYGVATAVVFDTLFGGTLGAGNTLSITAASIQDSPDGVTWQDFQPAGTVITAPAGVVATGPAGGGPVQGVSRYGIDLRMAHRYVRFTFTPQLSAAGGDTATLAVLATFAGFDRLPPNLGSPA